MECNAHLASERRREHIACDVCCTRLNKAVDMAVISVHLFEIGEKRAQNVCCLCGEICTAGNFLRPGEYQTRCEDVHFAFHVLT